MLLGIFYDFFCFFFLLFISVFILYQTQVQASTTLTFPEIMSKIPQIGLRGLYKGSIPAILGQFSRLYINIYLVFFYHLFSVWSLILLTLIYSCNRFSFNVAAMDCGQVYVK